MVALASPKVFFINEIAAHAHFFRAIFNYCDANAAEFSRSKQQE